MHSQTPPLENNSIAESINDLVKLNKHIWNIESISEKYFNIYGANQPCSKTANHSSKSAIVVKLQHFW